MKIHWWLILMAGIWAGGMDCAAGADLPVTTAESDTFGRQLERHFNHNDRLFYVNSFDFPGFADKVIPSDVSDDTIKDGLQRGLRQGLEIQLQQPKSLKFLHATQMEGQPCVLMRLLMTNGAVNYQDIFLKHGADGAIRMSDVYVYLSAEKLSDSMRRMAIPMIQEKNKSMLDRMFGETPDTIKYMPQWRGMAYAVQKGNNQEALDTYDQLPDDLKKEKFVLVLELRAAQDAHQAAYLAALKLWRDTYPSDASMDLLSIDYFLLLKQYDKALESVNRLDKAVGGDPYQDFNRAAIYSLMKDDANAEKFAMQAFTREPDLTKAGFFAMGLMREHKDYAGCVQVLDKMRILGGFTVTTLDHSLRVTPVDDELVKSDAYQEWFLSHARDSIPAAPPKPTN